MANITEHLSSNNKNFSYNLDRTEETLQQTGYNFFLLQLVFFDSSDKAQDLLGGWLLYREQFPCMNLECVFVCDLLDVCKNTDKSVWRFK